MVIELQLSMSIYVIKYDKIFAVSSDTNYFKKLKNTILAVELTRFYKCL